MLLSAVLTLVLPAAAVDEVGTYAASTRYVTLLQDDWYLWFQVHYPAASEDDDAEPDLSGGPYPVLLFFHGYLGQAWMYETACDSLASMGFVVVNMDNETHPAMDPYLLAEYGVDAMAWVADESATSGAWLHGMADDREWAVMGHSMGGIAMAATVDLEPRVSLVTGFAPYRDADYRWDAYADYDGVALLVGGDRDDTSTAAVIRTWYDDMDAPARAVWATVSGAGHQAITDIEFEEYELSDAEQLASNLDLAEAFVLAERTLDEDRYDALVCAPSYALTEAVANAAQPAMSVVAEADDDLRVGLVGKAGQDVRIYAGPGPGRGSTPDGVVGLAGPVEVARVSLAGGAACTDVALPPELAGIAWIQAVFVDESRGTFGRIVDVFGTGGAPGDTGADTGDGDSGDTQDTDLGDTDAVGGDPVPSDGSGCGGCATGGAPSAGVAAALAAAAIRRRRTDTTENARDVGGRSRYGAA